MKKTLSIFFISIISLIPVGCGSDSNETTTETPVEISTEAIIDSSETTEVTESTETTTEIVDITASLDKNFANAFKTVLTTLNSEKPALSDSTSADFTNILISLDSSYNTNKVPDYEALTAALNKIISENKLTATPATDEDMNNYKNNLEDIISNAMEKLKNLS